MPNYKELYFKSQAALADAIAALESVQKELIACMNECEETVISDESEDEE